MKKWIYLAVAVALAVCVGFVVVQPDKTGTQVTSAAQSPEYSQLAAKLSALTRERNQLKSEYEQKVAGLGTLTLLFADVDELLTDLAIPLMEQNNLTGVLAFSDAAYPGAQGCITMETWLDLSEKGWEYCLLWDGSTPMAAWLAERSAQMAQLGLAAPETLYCTSGAPDNEALAAMTEGGVRTVIYETTDNSVFLADLPEEGPWVLGGMPYTVSKAGTQSNSINSAGGSLAMLVPDTTELMSSRLALFESMIETLATRQNLEMALITTISNAREQRLQNIAASNAMALELEEKLLEIDRQITEVDSQIDAMLETGK